MAEGGVPDVETQKTYIANQLQKPLIQGEIWYGLNIAQLICLFLRKLSSLSI